MHHRHIHTERFFRYTRDIVGKNVVDSGGFVSGKAKDLVAMLSDGENPDVIGIVAEKKFVPWNMVEHIGDDIRLKVRWFSIGPNPIPGEAIFLRHILDEQLVDPHNRALGRVDEIGLRHDAASHRLHMTHILSGPFLRIGLGMGLRKIPWHCVMKVRKTKPTAIVLRLDRMRSLPHSVTDKMMVRAR
jgi:sporulation protein YlmC with PRC-barrel domain